MASSHRRANLVCGVRKYFVDNIKLKLKMHEKISQMKIERKRISGGRNRNFLKARSMPYIFLSSYSITCTWWALVEKLELMYTVGGKVKWCHHYGKWYQIKENRLK